MTNLRNILNKFKNKTIVYGIVNNINKIYIELVLFMETKDSLIFKLLEIIKMFIYKIQLKKKLNQINLHLFISSSLHLFISSSFGFVIKEAMLLVLLKKKTEKNILF